MGLRELATRLILNNLHAQFPHADEQELYYQLNVRCFGQKFAEQFFPTERTPFDGEKKMLNEVQIITMTAKRLDEAKIPYYLGGGVASINYGEPRLTNDADFVIRIMPFHIPKLVKAFEQDFVISADAVQDALNRRYAFNIIHIETAFKIDFYPIADDEDMSIEAFSRRLPQDIGGGEIWMASAEDVILAKLDWFRKGGKVSDKQWRDVLGVLKVQGERLDFAYLESMAGRFGLADLLERARDDAGAV